MKYYKLYFFIALAPLVFQSCIKDKTVEGGSSLTIINLVIGSNPLVTNFSEFTALDGYYATSRQINYGSYSTNFEFGSFSSVTNLKLYHIPDTMPHSSPLYNLTLDLPVGSTHTLFLTGKVNAPDTLVTTDYPPYHPETDSCVGVRFVNLSPGSNPVNVTLSTNSTVNEVSSLLFKNITDFKNYLANSSVSSYTFQFRDMNTNAILGSFTMSGINNGTGTNTSTNNYRFRNFTIALIGLPGGTGGAAQKALLINNY